MHFLSGNSSNSLVVGGKVLFRWSKGFCCITLQDGGLYYVTRHWGSYRRRQTQEIHLYGRFSPSTDPLNDLPIPHRVLYDLDETLVVLVETPGLTPPRRLDSHDVERNVTTEVLGRRSSFCSILLSVNLSRVGTGLLFCRSNRQGGSNFPSP